MKYTVKINGEVFEVEVLDIKTRPVIAIVAGEQVEVWPDESGAAPRIEQASPSASSAALASQPTGAVPSGGALDTKTVRAPIPGVILEVLIREGEAVEYGQPLFTIEAMKMRNKIRAAQSGTVAEVCVTPGQTVNHNDKLLEYTD